MGTAIESGSSQAILMTGDGRIVFARVGQTVEDATLRHIAPGRVEVEHHGQTTVLQVEGP